MTEPIVHLRCRQVVVGYGKVPMLPPIDLEIRAGEFWAVLGRNGSGKSTWFKTVLRLLKPVSGVVEEPNGEVRFAYVAQRIKFDEIYPVTARDVVAMGQLRGWNFLDPLGTKAKRSALDALDAVDAAHLADRLFRTLSEGQKQRVLLARMINSGAQVALLDEPTAAMDSVAEREAMDLLDQLRQRFGLAVVVVTHHLGSARRHGEKVLYVDREGPGAVVIGTPDEILHHPAFTSRYGDHGEEAHV